MEIYTPAEAQEQLISLIKKTNDSHEPVYINSDKAKNNHQNAVLLSEEDYRALLETLYISSIPGLKDKILKASNEPIESCAEEINW